MRNACKTLLSKCNVVAPPIPLVEIGKSLGLRGTKASQFYNKPPSLRQSNGLYEIWFRPSHIWRRDRFTIAHEIAHMLIIETLRDKSLIAQLYQPEQFQELERLCNIGAAELLIPEIMFWESLKAHGISSLGLRHFYDTYLVSQQMLLIRFTELIPFSAMVLWKKYGDKEKTNVKLRVVGTISQYRHPRFFGVPKGCSAKYIDPDIVTPIQDHRLLADKLTLKHSKPYIYNCVGVADKYFINSGKSPNEQLFFQGLPINDETSSVDSFLLIIDANKAADSEVWTKHLQHHFQ